MPTLVLHQLYYQSHKKLPIVKIWQRFITASAACWLLSLALPSQAQTGQTNTLAAKPPATVQAFGEHLLDLQPEKVRLLLIAKAEGASAKEAVARLTKHKEAVRGELTAMKAEANSIKMTSSEMRHHILGIPPQYQNMNAKFFTNLLEGSLNIRLEDLPTVHTATCVIEADWVLPEGDSDLVLQFPNSLREQVAERDLVGDDNGVELSPEQSANITKFKAAIDEHMGFYDENSPQDQQVQVLFVASIKPEARAAALKSAFEKAREECQLLATASGHKLGRLVSLSKATPDDSSASNGFSLGLGSDTSDVLVARMTKATKRDEATARQADGLQARFQVRALFEVE